MNTNANTTTETCPHMRGMFLTSLFCIFQPLFFCTHNRISQNYPPYRMSGKEGKNRYYNGVNVFFEYITLYLRGVPE